MGKRKEIPEATIVRLYNGLGTESRRIVFGQLQALQPKKVKAKTDKKGEQPPAATNGSDDDAVMSS